LGDIPTDTHPYQHLVENPPATDLHPGDSRTTVEGFEDVTPPGSSDHQDGDIPPATSPDHQSENNPLVKNHDKRDIPRAASQDQLKRDISLATSSDQDRGDIPPSPTSRTPKQSNSQFGDRFLGAVQSVFSPDGATMNDGWSPNLMP
jgi:hypothetical protein